MRIRQHVIAALFALLPAAAFANEGSLRGSPASMNRQHEVAVEEELTFYRTPDAILAEVAQGTLTALEGNDDYRIADVSFAYAVPEVRLFVERLAQQYREACGERLVVTSLTRPKTQQPRNAHALSVHPAGMAVDLRISQSKLCRGWLENTLLALESAAVLDVTRERMPPHYHVAVFPSAYRDYVTKLAARESRTAEVQAPPAPEPQVVHASVAALPSPRRNHDLLWAIGLCLTVSAALMSWAVQLHRRRRHR